jgi:hypothetical protein
MKEITVTVKTNGRVCEDSCPSFLRIDTKTMTDSELLGDWIYCRLFKIQLHGAKGYKAAPDRCKECLNVFGTPGESVVLDSSVEKVRKNLTGPALVEKGFTEEVVDAIVDIAADCVKEGLVRKVFHQEIRRRVHERLQEEIDTDEKLYVFETATHRAIRTFVEDAVSEMNKVE